MESIAKRRDEIYEHFHASQTCQEYFFDPVHEVHYVTYYTSMYLLQDSTESLWAHRQNGFDADPLKAYLEFWGVMQAVAIQQDSISELFQLLVETALPDKILPSWSEIRMLRNTCAGHPVRRDRPRALPMTRTFMGRKFGNYDCVSYERWEQGAGTAYPAVNLGALLDSYALEAAAKLAEILAAMRKRWPR